MIRSYLQIIWSLLLLVFLANCKSQNSQRSIPNFIIIFADDLGYGDLGSYGHPSIRTPHLDQMAREGMRFSQFYVAASICTPSRAGLLTGKLPVRNGMDGKRSVLFPDSGGGLPSSELTISSALKENGYATACIGKWHLGHLPQYLPTQHGFEEYFGIPYSNDMAPKHVNWEYAKENFPPLPLMEGDKVVEIEPEQSQLTQRYTQKAISFIERNKGKPFFLYLAHTFPHTPLYIDDENDGRSKRGLYGDVVEVLDESVGEILETLKRLGLDDNTFVIFTSDNGPWGWAGINGGSAGLLRGAKGSPWEGGFRVPAVAWMPGSIPAHTFTNAIGSTLDLLPTFLSMAGKEIPDQLDGIDLSDTFLSNKAVRNEMFYYRQGQMVAYRQGPWKLFIRDPNPWNDEFSDEDLPLLYHMEHDPAEKFNVADEHPEVVKDFMVAAEKHQAGVVPVPSQIDRILPEFQAAFDKMQNK